MTRLFTASYRAWHAGLGQPVVTSLGLPKWLPEAAEWPRCWLIAPTWQQFGIRDNWTEFERSYLERCERKGAQKFSRALHAIAREHQADRLVLLCHEQSWDQCHRGLWASWWLSTTGELAEELAAVTTREKES